MNVNSEGTFDKNCKMRWCGRLNVTYSVDSPIKGELNLEIVKLYGDLF